MEIGNIAQKSLFNLVLYFGLSNYVMLQFQLICLVNILPLPFLYTSTYSVSNHLILNSPMNQKTILLLVVLLIIFGAINTIQLKLQNIHILNTQTRQKFFHPFTQTILLFIGEACAGFFYLYHCYRQGKKSKETTTQESLLLQQVEVPAKPVASFMKAFWPAVFDLLATLFSYLALNTVDSSVWQMSKGGVIVTTAVLSRIFLKRIFTQRAIIGCSLAFLGITGVQIVAVLSASSQINANTTGQLIGLGLLFISIMFNSFGLIIEKKIFDKYELHPLKMVYAQGVIGFVLMSLLTFGFQFIPCPWLNKTQCVCISADACYLQNYSKYFVDLCQSSMLIMLTVGFICSIAISVPIGAFLSKEVSPISRSLANVSRTLLIWLFNIIMTETLGQSHSQYNLQSRDPLVNCLKGLGFAVLMLGTFLYHQKKKDPQSSEVQSKPPINYQIISEELIGQDSAIIEQNKPKSEADTNFDSQDYKDEEVMKEEKLIIN